MSWIKKLLAKFFAWTVKDLWAKAVKATGGFLSAAVFAWLLGIYAQLSNSEFPTSVEGAWQLIARAPSALIVAINNHPYHAGSYAFLIALSLAFVFLLRRAHWKLHTAQELLAYGATYRELIDQIGLAGRWPHAAPDDSGASWSKLCEDILRPDNTFVCILGANGAETFGQPGSPLYEALERLNGRLQVILLKPDGASTRARAQAVDANLSAYKRHITVSKKRLAEFSRRGRSVDLRYYDGQPNWKMIITNEKAWIQYYNSSGRHIADTPVYMFFNSEHEYSFYNIFYSEFCRVWERCRTSEVKLS